MPNGEFEHLSDREILVLIADRTRDLPKRVDALESAYDRQSGFVKAIAWVGSVLMAILSLIFGVHVSTHK